MNHLQLIKISRNLESMVKTTYFLQFSYFFAKYKNKCLKIFSLTFLRQNLDWRKIWGSTRAGKNTWNNFLTTFLILRFYNFYLLSKTLKIYQRFLKTSTPIFKMALKKLFRIDSEWLRSRDWKSEELRYLGYFWKISNPYFSF